METALVGRDYKWEDLNKRADTKAAKAEDTSTCYKSPTCEECPSSPEQQTVSVQKGRKLELIEEDGEPALRGIPRSRPPPRPPSSSSLRKPPAQAPSLPKAHSVTWSAPLSAHSSAQSDVTSSFSQATTAASMPAPTAGSRNTFENVSFSNSRPFGRPHPSYIYNDKSSDRRPLARDARRSEYGPVFEPDHSSTEDDNNEWEDVRPEGSDWRPKKTRHSESPIPSNGSSARAARLRIERQRKWSRDRALSRERAHRADRGTNPPAAHYRSPSHSHDNNNRPPPDHTSTPYVSPESRTKSAQHQYEHASPPYSSRVISEHPFHHAYEPYRLGSMSGASEHHHDPYSYQHQLSQHGWRPSQPVPPTVQYNPFDSSQSPPLTFGLGEARPSTDLEFIEHMEKYLEEVKQKNEKKLLDANRVLAYINRLSGPTTEIPQIQNVDSFRTPDEESNSPDDDTASSVISHTRNLSASTRSILTQSTPRFNIPDDTNESSITQRAEMPQRICAGNFPMSLYSEPLACRAVLPRISTHDILQETLARSHMITQTQGSTVSERPTEDTVRDGSGDTLLEELNALRQNVTALEQQRLTQQSGDWFSVTASSIYLRCRKFLRKGPPLGTQRLEWTCECGEDLFADLPVANASEYQQMLEFLTRPTLTARPAGQDRPTPSHLEEGTAQLNYTSPSLSVSSFSNGQSAGSTDGSVNTYVGSSSSQIFTSPLGSPFAKTKYLELCVDTGKYETKLAEIQVTSSQAGGATICTDGHLFRKINDRYFALRKHTWRRFLYRPAGIKFVHFGVRAGHQVSFFSRDPLPPEDAITTKRYEYNLQPPVPPPMDSRTFLHYFYKHNMHSHSLSAHYVDRLPKKLGESLTRSLGVDELREGWGIHIIEGPNKVAICCALMIVLVASFGVSIGYDLITKAEDSGFAIGQWMVATLTVGFSALYFSLEDEVISNFD